MDGVKNLPARMAAFNNCQNFTVTGGTFNIQGHFNENNDDFRVIRLGDLNLLKEIDKQNVVEYRDIRRKRTGAFIRRVPVPVGVRRIHHARIFGSQETVTAVVYEGSGFRKHRAQAEWREEFRHPTLVQLLGVASGSRGPKALIYNDELLPIDEVRKFHRLSALARGYLEYQMSKHFRAAVYHWAEATGCLLVSGGTGIGSYSLERGVRTWIRMSTGQLCIEVNDEQETHPGQVRWRPYSDSTSFGINLTDPNLDQELIAGMTLDDINHILADRSQLHGIDVADPGTVFLGSLSWAIPTSSHAFHPYSEFPLSDHLRLSDVHVGGWECTDAYTLRAPSFWTDAHSISSTGWTRLALVDLPTAEARHTLTKSIYLVSPAARNGRKIWLSQANYIMSKLRLDAVIITQIFLRFTICCDPDEFTLRGTFMADTPTDGVYLFLFPADISPSGGLLALSLPPEDETYYWSLDPQGIQRLPRETAEELGLPEVQFQATVEGIRWDQNHHDAIRQVHLAKGFDPDSQAVAIQLGYPLVDVDKLNNAINGHRFEVVDEDELDELNCEKINWDDLLS
ncbi:hypothetical protein MVEN_01403500 [Mycena venus]|uniref:Uncharacterized protein n=1 Tax=Mycena venus TaxID=2733690 RepID=A0A8H7CSQ4_9AGAR|nr:hypothetical protein MVEN_01403500 [Mycena venus]